MYSYVLNKSTGIIKSTRTQILFCDTIMVLKWYCNSSILGSVRIWLPDGRYWARWERIGLHPFNSGCGPTGNFPCHQLLHEEGKEHRYAPEVSQLKLKEAGRLGGMGKNIDFTQNVLLFKYLIMASPFSFLPLWSLWPFIFSEYQNIRTTQSVKRWLLLFLKACQLFKNIQGH